MKVTSFKFTGVKAVTDGQLRSVLATTPSSRLPWGDKHYFSREQFNADLKRIEAFYKDRGFPDARVSSYDVQPNKDQTAVKITVTVSEGNPIRRRAHRLRRARAPPRAASAVARSKPSAEAGATAGPRALAGEPRSDARRAEGSRISVRERAAWRRIPDRRTASESSRFTPSPERSRDSVRSTSKATPASSDRIIRRQLTFRPGQIYQQSKVLDSQRRLYNLELFQFASVKSDTLEQAAEIPTKVTVKEGKHRKVNFCLGYGSEERARAEIDWRHVNFFGGARTADVVARYSGLDRGVKVNLTEPYFFSRNYSSTLSGQVWHSDEPAYVLDTTGGRADSDAEVRPRDRPWVRSRAGTPRRACPFTYANEYESSVITDGGARRSVVPGRVDCARPQSHVHRSD